jgi:hypothetical protein
MNCTIHLKRHYMMEREHFIERFGFQFADPYSIMNRMVIRGTIVDESKFAYFLLLHSESIEKIIKHETT